MKRWLIGALVGACVGVAAYLAVAKKNSPAPAGSSEAPTRAVAPPAAPVVLGRVVEVADLDPLLDPPAKPAAGVPFDTDPATTPVSTPAAPDRIPPAVD
jgi:hypothetical protein